MVLNCPCCFSTEVTVEIKNYYSYRLYNCNVCGCTFCDPFKGPIRSFYNDASDFESLRRHTTISKWPLNHPVVKSNIFKDCFGKTILDIGCGNGDFLEYASSLGMKVIGIDIDENSLLIARSRGLKDSEFHNTTLIEFAKSEEIKFDFISMFEVFEHLDNPNETIQIIKNLLKKDGVFIGTLPNERRFCAKSLNLEYALPPYHLTFWIRKTWTKYLELNGFTTITCANTVYYGYLCDILYFRVLKSFQEIRKRKFLTFSTKVIFTIIKPIEAIIEKITKRSSSFYFEFQSKN